MKSFLVSNSSFQISTCAKPSFQHLTAQCPVCRPKSESRVSLQPNLQCSTNAKAIGWRPRLEFRTNLKAGVDPTGLKIETQVHPRVFRGWGPRDVGHPRQI